MRFGLRLGVSDPFQRRYARFDLTRAVADTEEMR